MKGTRNYIRRVIVAVIIKVDLRTFKCRDCDIIQLYWGRSCDESLVTSGSTDVREFVD